MVNTLTHHMDTIFNPLIQNTTQTNQQLTTKMAHIVDSLALNWCQLDSPIKKE